jgi:hypothetical protein
MIDELRKLDAEIGWLVFSDLPDEGYRFVAPMRSDGCAASTPLPHYTGDPAAAQRITEHFEKHRGSVVFSDSGDERFPVLCTLKIGDIEGWSDASAAAREKPIALCMAVLRAADRILAINGARYVRLDFAIGQAAESWTRGDMQKENPIGFEVPSPNGHLPHHDFAQEELRKGLTDGTLLFGCPTCGATWSPDEQTRHNLERLLGSN